jgi:hypothetical protein
MIFDSFLNQKFFIHYFSILIGFLFALTQDLSATKAKEDALNDI